MKVNLYYEFPNDTALINGSIKPNWVHNFVKVANKLIEEYPEIEFKKVVRWSGNMASKNPWSRELGVPFDKNTHASISDTIFIIENVENKKYFAITMWDKGYWEISAWSDLDENCVEVFAHAGMHIDDYTYKLSPIKYTPLNIPTIMHEEENFINEFYHNNLKENKRVIPDKLFFQTSTLYLFRKYIFENEPYRYNLNLGYDRDLHTWFNKLSQFKVNMDINCVAEPSGRISQIMGLGTALIRPKLNHKFQNDLIPNYHYILVEHDNFDAEKHHNIEKYYQSLSNAYIDTYERVKKEIDLIDFVSKNGREYWENHCLPDKWVSDTVNLIDLNKLK